MVRVTRPEVAESAGATTLVYPTGAALVGGGSNVARLHRARRPLRQAFVTSDLGDLLSDVRGFRAEFEFDLGTRAIGVQERVDPLGACRGQDGLWIEPPCARGEGQSGSIRDGREWSAAGCSGGGGGSI